MKKGVKLVAAVLVASLVASMVPALNLPGADVSMVEAASAKSQMKKLTKAFVNFTGSVCISNSSDSYYLGFDQKRTYDFSKNKARGIVASIPTDYVYDADTNSYHDTSFYAKHLFGKGASNAPEVRIGDWGESWPELQIRNYKKIKNGKYRVDFTVKWKDIEGGNKTIGYGNLYVKKKSGSKYGFVATKLVIKRNSTNYY